MSDWRQRYHHYSTLLYGPSRSAAWLSWIGDQRIAIGGLPTAATLPRLPEHGITHIVGRPQPPRLWSAAARLSNNGLPAAPFRSGP
jgi:hypothetical protein